MKKVLVRIISLVFIASMLCAFAKADTDPARADAIQAVTESIFTSPDLDFATLSYKDMKKHYEDECKEYFTNDGFDQSLKVGDFYLSAQKSQEAGNTIAVDKVDIKKKETSYTFKVSIIVTDSAGFETDEEASGTVQFDDKSKIKSFKISKYPASVREALEAEEQ